MHNGMSRNVAALFVASLLVGCGGGSSDANTFSVSATAATGGTVTPGSATAKKGDTVSFIFTANTGYNLASASGCGGVLSGSTFTTGPITAQCAVAGSFALKTYTIGAQASVGGSASPTSVTVDHGATITFTLTPDPGYALDQVTGCAGALNGSAYTTDAVTAECTISASFAKTGTLTASLKDYISSPLVLVNNGSDDLTLVKVGDETFSVPVKDGATYDVSVLTQPTGQLCTVVDGQGTFSLLTPSKAYVTCRNLVQTDDGFAMVSKLAAGTGAVSGGSQKTSVPSASQATSAQASDQFLYVPSRPDAVHVFRINGDGTLVEHVAPYTHPYDGFRPHFRMSADGKVAYFAHQLLTKLIIGLSVDDTTGALTETGTVEMQMTNATNLDLSPSGRTVYVKGSTTSGVCPIWSTTGTCSVAEIGFASNTGSQFFQVGGVEKVPGSTSSSGGWNFTNAFSIAHFGKSSYYYPTVGEIHRYRIDPQSELLSYLDQVRNLSGSLDPMSGMPSIAGRLYVDRSGNRLYQVFNGFSADRTQIPGSLLEPQIGVHAVAEDGSLSPLAVISGTADISGLCAEGFVPSRTTTLLTPPVEDVRGHFLYTSQTAVTTCMKDGSGDGTPRIGQGIFAYDISAGIENARLIAGAPFFPGKVYASAFFLVRHPTRDWLYATNQDGGSIDGYRINTSTGALTKMQGSPFGTAKSPGTGESLVKIDATGKFLYLMAPLEVFAFAINQDNGELSLIGSYPLTVQ